MRKCTLCNKNLWIRPKHRSGLCKACYSTLKENIVKTHKLIDQKTKVIDNSINTRIRIQHCNEIIEHARQYLSYEQIGLKTLTPKPSELISFYKSRHDEIIVKIAHKKIEAALANVEKTLKPLGKIYEIEHLLKSVVSARENIRPYAEGPVTIALINQKGGVGKTTSTINIGAGLSQLGKRVLLIDFDPQSNLTEGLGFRDLIFDKSTYEVLKGNIKCENAVIKRGNLDLIPANVLLARFENEMPREDNNIFFLRDALKGLDDYDFVLIDCLPSLGLLTLNALAAANEVFIPVQTDYFSFSGISKIIEAIKYINGRYNANIKITGIFCTFLDLRLSHSKAVLAQLHEKYSDVLFETYIRDNVSLMESGSFGKTIFEYKPKSYGANDYMKLCEEILCRLGKDRNISL